MSDLMFYMSDGTKVVMTCHDITPRTIIADIIDCKQRGSMYTFIADDGIGVINPDHVMRMVEE